MDDTKMNLPIDGDDVPLVNADGTPNYQGHIALNTKEKAEAYGYGFLFERAECAERERKMMEMARRCGEAYRLKHEARIVALWKAHHDTEA